MFSRHERPRFCWKNINSSSFFFSPMRSKHPAKILLVRHDQIRTEITIFRHKIQIVPQVSQEVIGFCCCISHFSQDIALVLRQGHCRMGPAEDLGAQCRPSTAGLAPGIHLSEVPTRTGGRDTLVSNGTFFGGNMMV